MIGWQGKEISLVGVSDLSVGKFCMKCHVENFSPLFLRLMICKGRVVINRCWLSRRLLCIGVNSCFIFMIDRVSKIRIKMFISSAGTRDLYTVLLER
jgi:hypothetical protein